MRLWLIGALAAACTACMPPPKVLDDADAFSADGSDYPDQATVYVFRSAHPKWSPVSVVGDKKGRGWLGFAKYVTFPVRPGTRVIAVNWLLGPPKAERAIQASFQAGRTYYFEYGNLEQGGFVSYRLTQLYPEEAATYLAITHSPEDMSGKGGPYYSSAETTAMTACVGLADTARAIAERKMAEEPRVRVKAYYAAQPNAGLTVPLVDKVYGDPVRNTGIPERAAVQYAVAFFRECALNLASVPNERSRLAAHCLRNGMLAGMVQQDRSQGTAMSQVYDRFMDADDTLREIVKRVYARSGSRGEEQLAEWNSCTKPLTGP